MRSESETTGFSSGWMSGWIESDGVLSSFHFNVFRISVQIRASYALPRKPLEFQRFSHFWVLGFDWKWFDKFSYARRHKALKLQHYILGASQITDLRV